MNKDREIEEVRCEIEQYYKNRKNLWLPKKSLRISEDEHLSLGNKKYRLSDKAEADLSTIVGIKHKISDRLPKNLRAELYNYLLETEEGSVGLSINEGTVEYLKHKKPWMFSAISLIDTQVEVSRKLGIKALVQEYHCDGDFFITLVSPVLQESVRPGDIIQGGLDVYQNGDQIQVSHYMLRLVCSNGMLTPLCEEKSSLSAKNLDEVRDMSIGAWNKFGERVDALRELAKEQISNPIEALHRIAHYIGLSGFFEEIKQAFYTDELGFDGSGYGLINAVSRVASHLSSLTLSQRRRAMLGAGILSQEKVHRCRLCSGVIYNSGHVSPENNDSAN